MAEHAVRKRLRMHGRPLLSLIERLLVEKRAAAPGTTIQFEWQRAHTNDQSLQAVANRCADFVAKRAIQIRPVGVRRRQGRKTER